MNENEPYFPRDERYQGHNGITILAEFAKVAMQSLLAQTQDGYPRYGLNRRYFDGELVDDFTESDAKDIAERAVIVAKAMIAELNKEAL